MANSNERTGHHGAANRAVAEIVDNGAPRTPNEEEAAEEAFSRRIPGSIITPLPPSSPPHPSSPSSHSNYSSTNSLSNNNNRTALLRARLARLRAEKENHKRLTGEFNNRSTFLHRLDLVMAKSQQNEQNVRPGAPIDGNLGTPNSVHVGGDIVPREQEGFYYPETIPDDSDNDDNNSDGDAETATTSPCHQNLVSNTQLTAADSLKLAVNMGDCSPVGTASAGVRLDLVETMRLEREMQMIEFYKSQNGGVLPEGFVLGGCGGTSHHHEKYTVDDDYYMDDMGGWGMGATPNTKQQRQHQRRNPTTVRHHHHHQLEEDDIVSNQLKGMLRHKSTLALSDHDTVTMTDEEEGGRGFIMVGRNHNEHQGDDSHHCSYRCTLIQKHLRKFNNNTACIFLLGFILGTIVIVRLSVKFDKTPSEEMNALRKHGAYSDNFEGKVHLGDSMDINAIDQDDIDEEEDDESATEILEAIIEVKKEEQIGEEHDFTNFCKKCQWKNSVFDCAQRVRWEMKQYHMSEHEAMMTNVDHCTSPGGVPPPNEKTLEEKEEENEIKMEEELGKEEVESAAASP